MLGMASGMKRFDQVSVSKAPEPEPTPEPEPEPEPTPEPTPTPEEIIPISSKAPTKPEPTLGAHLGRHK